MEKFAVDIEKVLNDFEYSEEQLNEYSSEQRTINNAYSCNYKIYPPYRTPAANYRRPPFEPVNLADADFSVSASPSSTQILPNYDIESYSNPPSKFDTSEQLNIENVDDVRDKERSMFENQTYPKNKDFKPDLIESNTDICSNLNEFSRVERHLPDIASADVEIKDEKVEFDLINRSVDSRKPKTLIEVPNQEIISFPITSDVPESELHQYLKELEEHEFGKDDEINYDTTKPEYISNVIQTNEAISALSRRGNSEFVNCDKNKILIKIESQDQLYLERPSTEVKERDVSKQLNENETISETTVDAHSHSNVFLDNVTTLEVNNFDYNDISTPGEIKTESSTLNVSHNIDSLRNNDSEENDSTAGSMEEVNDCKKIRDCFVKDAVKTEEYDHQIVSEEDAKESVKNDGVQDPVLISTSFSKDYQSNDEAFEYIMKSKMEEKGTEIFKRNENKMDSIENKEVDKLHSVEQFNNSERHNRLIDIAQIKGTCETSITSSETNHQILDSKTAISIFGVTDESSAKTSTSRNGRDEHHSAKAETEVDPQPKLQRPDSLNLIQTTQNSEMSSTSADSGSLLSAEERKLGKEQPFWIPDSETTVCMHCQMKFTLVKRRHHCRACGLVLCSKCCDMKASLEYLGFEEARVCHSCHSILERINNFEAEISSMKRPNPNNPMEYCSTIPPLLQVGPTHSTPPSVLVPVSGVLKREGRIKTNDTPKQVIFSDGIRPGGDLTELDVPSEPRLPLRRNTRLTKRVGTPPGNMITHRRMLNPETRSFIPSNNDLPPLVTKMQGEFIFSEIEKPLTVNDGPVKFAINRNLLVIVERIILDCCVNRDVWCMTTEGLSCVGQDEIIFILEVFPEEKYPPKDIFLTVNILYQEASKGTTVTEMSFSSPFLSQLLGSKEHGGFIFIRPTYQCIQKLLLPKAPFLVALLIHRWETPWARLFPIRLVLRLGAEFRYYPCPLVSVRNRAALFTDIGHTIISLLADFRKYSYSLPTVRGLMIHMEDKLTTILLPRNRYDQVIRAMNNSEENVLAFAGNISTIADSHLVCIQSTQDDTSYTTQAINIHNKPRQVTGASFIVFNGSLKQCAWAGKSNIVEDGLMVQIPSESMANLRSALKRMNDYTIGCGPQAEEMVVLRWAPDDINFNIGVKSNIDNKSLDGVPSIRVHNGTDYSGSSHLIRWTEVFILQSDEDCGNKTGDMVNISKLSESIARATCVALVPLLDLLASANLSTLAVRASIHPENVGYEAGSRCEKLPPLYMKSLDETLIAVVHEAALAIRDISYPIVLELIFKIMEQG